MVDARKAGAASEESPEVIQGTTIMGIHSMTIGVPILPEEIARHEDRA
jgi:hypothetical protein